MAAAVRAGALARRGTDRLSTEQLAGLLENPKRVKELCSEIDEKRKLYLAAEQKSLDAFAALGQREANLAKREAAVVEAELALKEAKEGQATQHKEAMAALTRRTKEITDREALLVEATDALASARSHATDHARERETELAAREVVTENRETASDVREQDIAERFRTLEDRTATLFTIEKMMVTAANKLRTE